MEKRYWQFRVIFSNKENIMLEKYYEQLVDGEPSFQFTGCLKWLLFQALDEILKNPKLKETVIEKAKKRRFIREPYRGIYILNVVKQDNEVVRNLAKAYDIVPNRLAEILVLAGYTIKKSERGSQMEPEDWVKLWGAEAENRDDIKEEDVEETIEIGAES